MSQETPDRRVWLVRHAKAAEARAGQRDFDRGLTGRGERQCRALGEWLRGRLGDRKPSVRVSPAVRARATAELALASWYDGDFASDDRIWNATADRLRELITSGGGDLIVVGHNPGLEQLQAALTGQLMPMPPAGAFELSAGENGRWTRVASFQPASEST